MAVKAFKVVVAHEYPPIPVRTMDYCAYVDGEEERGNYGWGATPAEALRELAEIIEEEAAEEHRLAVSGK